MEKKGALRISAKITVFVIALTFILLIPVNFALANSLPPPSIVWFTFEYKTAQPPHLLGLQVVACETENCEQPVLMQQYGICERDGCLKTPAKLTGEKNTLGCAADKCRSTAFPFHGETYFKLVAQFSDRVRESRVTQKLPSQYGEETAWRVIMGETDLTVEKDTIPVLQSPLVIFKNNTLRIGLSIFVELLVAGVCFQIWAKTDFRHLMGRLLIVFLANLITLSVVWFFFPSLGYFQSSANTTLGIMVLFAAFVYAALLAGIYRSRNKTRWWLVALTTLSIPFTVVCSLITFSFTNGYYGSYVTAQGLPSSVIIIASEVFAVVVEAILITILCKGSLPLRLIWITSLLMNTASFLTGQILNITNIQ
jgi:hypothetical protein